MTVAYVTADFEAVSSIFSDPDKFLKADPFPFLLTALIVFAFGPGRFSVDALLNWRWRKLAEKRASVSHRNSAPVKLA
jgi:putative oxidoreductase